VTFVCRSRPPPSVTKKEPRNANVPRLRSHFANLAQALFVNALSQFLLTLVRQTVQFWAVQIFLSHSSRQKPLVREIKKSLPQHLNPWLDEEKLLFGDGLSTSIESAIKCDSDYVILFVDNYAARSEWVRKEIAWAFQAEKSYRRTILLPVVVEDGALDVFDNFEIHNRKHLTLKDYLESSVQSLSASISAELFALICRDIHRLRQPAAIGTFARIADAENLLLDQAKIIRKAIFPHRHTNPISNSKLLEIFSSYSQEEVAADEFEAILAVILQRNMIPGFVYDGSEAYLTEEHAKWKSDIQRDKKEKVARKAVELLKNSVKVFFDAGSTTEEIVRLLCRRIENRIITKITIATTSVNIADMISDCCVKMGFDDEFTAVQLFIPGGRIRPNTQAIVPIRPDAATQVPLLGEAIGGFDICFVGVNGVTVEGGFMTHLNAEANNKVDVLRISTSRIIVGDSSKVGLCLECKFADFGDDVLFITDANLQNEELKKITERYNAKVFLT